MKDTFLKKNSVKIYSAIVFARMACQLILAGTSFILYQTYVPSIFEELNLPWFIHNIVSGFVIFLLLYATDGTLTPFLEYTLKERLDPEWKADKGSDKPKVKYRARRIIARIMAVVVFAQIAVTSTTSLWSSGEIADRTTEEVDTSRIDTIQAKENETYNTSLALMEKSYNTLRKSEWRRVKDVKEKHSKIIKSIVNSGMPYHKKLYEMNHPTFHNAKGRRNRTLVAYREKIQKAKDDSIASVNFELTRDDIQLAKLNDFIATGTQTKDAAVSAIAGVVNSELLETKVRKGRKTKTWIVVDIISIFLLLGLTVLKVLFDISTTNRKERIPVISGKDVLLTASKHHYNVTMLRIAKWLGVTEDQIVTLKPASVTPVKKSVTLGTHLDTQGLKDEKIRVLNPDVMLTDEDISATPIEKKKLKKHCCICGTDISHMRANAKTCGPTCRKEKSRRDKLQKAKKQLRNKKVS